MQFFTIDIFIIFKNFHRNNYRKIVGKLNSVEKFHTRV